MIKASVCHCVASRYTWAIRNTRNFFMDKRRWCKVTGDAAAEGKERRKNQLRRNNYKLCKADSINFYLQLHTLSLLSHYCVTETLRFFLLILSCWLIIIFFQFLLSSVCLSVDAVDGNYILQLLHSLTTFLHLYLVSRSNAVRA